MRTLKNAGFLTRLLSGFDQDWSTDGASLQPTTEGTSGMPDSSDHELLAAIKQRLDFLDSCDFEPWRAVSAGRQPEQPGMDAAGPQTWSDTTRDIRR